MYSESFRHFRELTYLLCWPRSVSMTASAAILKKPQPLLPATNHRKTDRSFLFFRSLGDVSKIVLEVRLALLSWWGSSISHLFTSVVAQPHRQTPPHRISDPAAIELWNSDKETLWIAKGSQATSGKLADREFLFKRSRAKWAHKYSPESVYLIKGCGTTAWVSHWQIAWNMKVLVDLLETREMSGKISFITLCLRLKSAY